MPDLPDVRTTLPDLAHEALRAGLVRALDDLAAEVRRLDGALLLLLSTADFAQGTLNTARAAHATLTDLGERLAVLEGGAAALQQAVAAQGQQLAALAERVAALEAPAEPAPDTPATEEV